MRERVGFQPHHQVLKSKKPGKVRAVFDCAAKYDGVCLNDCLLPGPDTLTDPVRVLLRFRREAVAVAADIEETFLQVKLRFRMRFLWWENEDLSAP